MILQDVPQAAYKPWHAPFSELPWVDQVGVVLVALFMALGIWRGMWWQIVRFLGVILSIALARSVAPKFQPTLQKVAGENMSEAVTHGVAWFVIFLGGLILATLFGMLGKKTLEAMQLGVIDRIGGAFVGALTGVVLHGALLILTSSLTDASWYQNNLMGTKSAQALAQVSQYELGPLHSEAKEKIFQGWGEQGPGNKDDGQKSKKPKKSK
ncbi:MAG: CvpA family protein [Planctomycetota bacterium]|nr:CvpA family protein [Planctomycetota bacterium]